MAIEKITEDQIKKHSMERLSNRPTEVSRKGIGGLSPEQLKKAQDALALLAIEKLNELIAALNADASAESIAAMIKTPIIDPDNDEQSLTLYDFLRDVVNGDLAEYFALKGLKSATLQDELSTIENDIKQIENTLGDEADSPQSAFAGTVFERLAYLYALTGDKGSTADSTGNIFARVAWVYNQLSALSSNKVDKKDGYALSKNDLTDDRLAVINSVGKPNDAANALGSAFARISAIIADIGNSVTAGTIKRDIYLLNVASKELENAIAAVRAIAESKDPGLVFASVAEFSNWLQDPNIKNVEANGAVITPEELNTGWTIYIIAQDEPDLWWDGSIRTAGTITVNGVDYVSTAKNSAGNVIGGARELEYKLSYTAIKGFVDDAAASAEDAKKWATGKDGAGVDVSVNDVQYKNSAKYHADASAASAANALASETSAAESEQEAKAAETRVNESISSLANAISNTVTGNILRIDDVSPIVHNVDVKVNGAANSLKVFGKNLLKKYANPSYTSNGITMTVKEDGSLVLNGTTTGTFAITLGFGGVLPKGDYAISFGNDKSVGGNSPYFAVRNEANTWVVSGTFNQTNVSKAIPSSLSMWNSGGLKDMLFAVEGAGITLNNFTIKPQLEIGSASEYAPYIEPKTYSVNADGTVDGVTSISPTMTMFTDSTDAQITARYNRDANLLVNNLLERLISLEKAILN